AEIDKCWQLPNDKKPMILQPHYQLALSQLWIKTLQTAGKAIDGTIAPFKRMNFTKSSGRRK
ncbi:siderophore biosynthesis protein, partial [Morganella morganii]